MARSDDLQRRVERLRSQQQENRQRRLAREAQARKLYSTDAGEPVLRRSFADPRIAAKYELLIGYHNWICSQFFDLPDALIDSDQPPPTIRLLANR